MTESIEARAAKWAASRDTGVSSKTIMAFMLTGEAPDPGYPHDASDLKRCLTLLEAVPEWEPRLGELSALPGVNGQCWKALAEKWDLLKARAGADAAGIAEDKRYEFVTRTMREILHPVEDASGQVARIGPNASITCGPDSAFGKAVIDHAKKHGGKAAAVRAKNSLKDGEKAVQAVSDILDGKNPVDNTSDVGGVAGKRLKSFIERIERLEEEKAGLAEDIKEVFAECKGVGFDVKIVRKILRLRKMDAEKRREEDELTELYKSAIGMD